MTPIAWSHSRLDTFKNCPKQFYRKFVAKDVEDPLNEAGNFGTRVHTAFEEYLKSNIPLTDETKHWQSYIDGIKAIPGTMLVECKYAIDKSLQPVPFFSSSAWCRGIIDTLHLNGAVSVAIDHKTGKQKPDSTQLVLCALLVFLHHPEVETVVTRFEWLKSGERTEASFERTDMDMMWAKFIPTLYQYKEAFTLEMFNPRPSGLCNGWCPVTDCEFWKPKRD